MKMCLNVAHFWIISVILLGPQLLLQKCTGLLWVSSHIWHPCIGLPYVSGLCLGTWVTSRNPRTKIQRIFQDSIKLSLVCLLSTILSIWGYFLTDKMFLCYAAVFESRSRIPYHIPSSSIIFLISEYNFSLNIKNYVCMSLSGHGNVSFPFLYFGTRHKCNEINFIWKIL